MSAAIALREDFEASDLRRIAKSSPDAAQSRRLLALATVYDGGSRSEAARIGSVDLQIIRDGVLRFNADGAAGLIDRKAPGKVAKLSDSQRQALAAKVESGPELDIDGVVRWRLVDLKRWIWREFAISLDERNVGRTLKAMNFVKLTARPRHHAQEDGAIEGFKKTSPPRWRKSAPNSQPSRT